jgi:threonine dehydrogenase-like Zn-dependent dehydrogenase
MKAFVMKEIGQVGFMDKPVPRPGPNDAVVQTTRALICTSDSHTVHGGIGPRQNLTLGHEAVGVVHDVGEAVQVFQPGDRVLVGAITPDWGDPASQDGYSSQSGAPLGGWKFSNTKDGVFAEYFHVTRPMPAWRRSLTTFPTTWPFTALTCSPPASWELSMATSRSAEPWPCSPRARSG